MCWWEVVGQTDDVNTVTWERFAKLFRDKYLGESHLAGKVREFLSLRQGRMSVAEYTAKFDELLRFAPTIVPTDDARKMKYMHGLRTEIVKQVDNGKEGPESYADAVQRALRNDGWDRQKDRTSGGRTYRPSDGQNKETGYEKKKQFQSRIGYFCKNNRFNFKKRDFSKDNPGQRNENRNRSGEPKRG